MGMLLTFNNFWRLRLQSVSVFPPSPRSPLPPTIAPQPLVSAAITTPHSFPPSFTQSRVGALCSAATEEFRVTQEPEVGARMSVGLHEARAVHVHLHTQSTCGLTLWRGRQCSHVALSSKTQNRLKTSTYPSTNFVSVALSWKQKYLTNMDFVGQKVFSTFFFFFFKIGQTVNIVSVGRAAVSIPFKGRKLRVPVSLRL